MEWIKLTIFTTAAGIDALCDRLYDIGFGNTQIEDEAEFEDFLESNKKYWDYVDDELLEAKKGETRVIIYIENNESATDSINSVNAMLADMRSENRPEWGSLRTETDGLNEEDWANNWKAYFKPIPVGKKILIQPEWEAYKGETDRIVFTVNPGLTFGTGTHNSTKLCIAALEDAIKPGCSMIDIGCGSGILSIISLMLGAGEATALDIDPNSVHVAYENARMNNVDESKYRVLAGDILTDKELFSTISDTKYDVVAANIVADVIIALLPTVKAIIAEGGTFVCSGIINERLSDVLSAMEKENVKVNRTETDGEWSAVVCDF